MRAEYLISAGCVFRNASGFQVNVSTRFREIEVVGVNGGLQYYSGAYNMKLVVESSCCYLSFIINVQERYIVEQRNIELLLDRISAEQWLDRNYPNLSRPMDLS